MKRPKGRFFHTNFVRGGRKNANRRWCDHRYQSEAEKGTTMKREFLQNIKVGDQPLPKEIIDAILDEHSRSIGAIKAEKESLVTQLQTAKDGLKAFEGVDVKDLQGQITKLQQELASALKELSFEL